MINTCADSTQSSLFLLQSEGKAANVTFRGVWYEVIWSGIMPLQVSSEVY